MVRIRCTLESETLHLPELQALIGKTVEITVQEEVLPEIIPGSGDWAAAARAAQRLQATGYDFDAWKEQRDYDVSHAQDRRP